MPVTLKISHDWNLSIDSARDIQKDLSKKVILKSKITRHKYFAGIDVGYDLKNNQTHAAVVIMDSEFNLIEKSTATIPTTFPYIPGYLSFREIPAIIFALQKLHYTPDILVCDGQGYAHPRRFGIACHLGVLTDLPAIGVAKKRLIGNYNEPPNTKGSMSDLIADDEIIGKVVRTRTNVKPVFVSPGHKFDFNASAELALKLTTKYRLPEPIRVADKLSRCYSAHAQ